MKLISILTGILTLTVALFSFIVSFVSLRTVAGQFAFPIPILMPLIIEAGVIIFSINALYRYLNREKAHWQWILVIFSSGLALTFNIIHAQDNWISRIMFGIPSLFFLLSFENFLSQISHITKKKLEKQNKLDEANSALILKQEELKSLENIFKQTQTDLNNSQALLEQNQTHLNLLETRIKNVKEDLQNTKIELKENKKQLEVSKGELENSSTRLNIILESIKSGTFRINNLANEFEVSTQTIYNDVKKLEKQNLIAKNGKGWIVND